MPAQRKIAPLDASELVDPAYLGTGTPDGTKFLRDDQTYAVPSGSGGAPDDVDYLVGTASGDLSAEIVVGATPGGELGGTWASPTVDATHSGSSHAGAVSTAEGYADSADAAHAGAADPHTGYQRESEKDAANGYAGLDSGALVPIAHLATGTPTGSKFIRDDGTLAVPSGTGAVASDPIWDAAGDLAVGTGADTAAKLTKGSDGQVLRVDPTSHLLAWYTPPADLSAIDFLVGTASGSLSGEIAVGTTPGGELGGTWASPTVDASHAGSSHALSNASVSYTGGDITTATSGANKQAFHASGLDVTIAAATGDVLLYSFNALMQGNNGGELRSDAATVVSGVLTNYLSGGSATTLELIGLYLPATQPGVPVSTAILYTVQAGDISGGTVTIRPVYVAAANAKTLKATGNYPVQIYVVNLRH